MRLFTKSPRLFTFAALFALVLLGRSSTEAREIVPPCPEVLADCWEGPVFDLSEFLNREPEPGVDAPDGSLEAFIARTIHPSLMELLRRVPGAGQQNDHGGEAVRDQARVQWSVITEEAIEGLHDDLSAREEGEGTTEQLEGPYGSVRVRTLGRDISPLDCEGVVEPLELNRQALGEGGGAMTMGLQANFLIDIIFLHDSDPVGLRFPLRVQVCKGGARLSTSLRRARFRSSFRRGHIGGAEPTVTSAVQIFSHLFLGTEDLACENEADVDADHEVTMGDGIKLLDHLFRGGEQPLDPFLREDFGDLDSQLSCDQPNSSQIVTESKRIPDLEILLQDLLNPGACTSATRGTTRCIDGLEHACMVENGWGSWVPVSPAQACSDVLGGGRPPIFDTETASGD